MFLRKTRDLSGGSHSLLKHWFSSHCSFVKYFFIWNETCNPLLIGRLNLFPKNLVKYLYSLYNM